MRTIFHRSLPAFRDQAVSCSLLIPTPPYFIYCRHFSIWLSTLQSRLSLQSFKFSESTMAFCTDSEFLAAIINLLCSLKLISQKDMSLKKLSWISFFLWWRWRFWTVTIFQGIGVMRYVKLICAWNTPGIQLFQTCDCEGRHFTKQVFPP